jgi:ferredoxin
MTHVVTKKCIGCKDKSCARICPVECFHVGPEMLYIDSDNCIDCEQCVAECPVDAIFHDDDLPTEHADDLELNAKNVLIFPVFDD